jgi:plasmid maintenance system killer protein
MAGPQREAALKAIAQFQVNERHPGLHFEKLAGYRALFSIRMGRGWRILLRREQDDAGDLYAIEDIGPHDVYRRF